MTYDEFAIDNGCNPGGALYEYGAKVWQAAQAEVLAQQTNNKQSPKCYECGSEIRKLPDADGNELCFDCFMGLTS